LDLLLEVGSEDDDHLFAPINDKIRAIRGVRAAKTFISISLCKQTYTWGAQ
jgi:Lrp/AsnC family transcriptional regulator for asnA, asnC and gidA